MFLKHKLTSAIFYRDKIKKTIFSIHLVIHYFHCCSSLCTSKFLDFFLISFCLVSIFHYPLQCISAADELSQVVFTWGGNTLFVMYGKYSSSI